MESVRSTAQESAEDLFFGQVVINWARWFLIAAGIVLVLWTSEQSDRLVIGITPVVALMAVNFYLHGRYLMERPANPSLIAVTSVIDLVIITTVVLVWPDQRGLASEFFILYYPVVLAYAFVMQPRMAAVYTVAALGAYTAACLVTGTVVDDDEAKRLIIRLITMASMGGLGTYFWRIQRDRRRTAEADAIASQGPEGSS